MSITARPQAGNPPARASLAIARLGGDCETDILDHRVVANKHQRF
jgi:hypothetical protein